MWDHTLVRAMLALVCPPMDSAAQVSAKGAGERGDSVEEAILSFLATPIIYLGISSSSWAISF